MEILTVLSQEELSPCVAVGCCGGEGVRGEDRRAVGLLVVVVVVVVLWLGLERLVVVGLVLVLVRLLLGLGLERLLAGEDRDTQVSR